jgi:nickel transport protein
LRGIERLSSLICILILFSTSLPAFAHGVHVFAWVVGDTVYSESSFPDGRPVQDGVLQVYDSENQLLLSGKTDSEGRFSFAIPKREDLILVLDASLGHRARYVVTAEELAAVPAGERLEGHEDRGMHGTIRDGGQRAGRARIRDIFAGFGYIVGITGLVMYLRGRRRS